MFYLFLHFVLYRPSDRVESVRSRDLLRGPASSESSVNDSERVRLPQQMRFDFTLRPQPKFDPRNAPSTKLDPDSKKAKLMKRMQVILKKFKLFYPL